MDVQEVVPKKLLYKPLGSKSRNGPCPHAEERCVTSARQSDCEGDFLRLDSLVFTLIVCDVESLF